LAFVSQEHKNLSIEAIFKVENSYLEDLLKQKNYKKLEEKLP